MKTILDTLDAGTQWLEKRGIEDARRHMQWLVCHILGLSRIELYTSFDQVMEEQDLATLRDYLKRRGTGEPLQHILGTVEFHRHEFLTDKRALIPRPETEELVELCLEHYSSKLDRGAKILDLGTGSGVLGISLALALKKTEKQFEITCADISSDALSLAKENAHALQAPNIHFLETDLFSQVSDSYDLIVANLPYIPETDRQSLKKEVTFDPDLALFSGEDGLDLIRRFCTEATNHIVPGGSIALEIGIHQHQQVETLLNENGFSNIHTHSDLSGIKRFPTASMTPRSLTTS